MATAIHQRFGEQVRVIDAQDMAITGNLEVRIRGGPTLHSKKGGDGFYETQEKIDKVLNGIAAYLAKQG